MGGKQSKTTEAKKDPHGAATFFQTVRSNVEDELARKMMLQREVQLAVQMARARDTLTIFGSAWLTLVTGVGLAKALQRPVPPVVGVPMVVGGLVLGNIADMAYGNKLNRIVLEAEYIMQEERGRLVPPQQAAFAKFYTAEERQVYHETSTPVSRLWPNRLFVPRPPSPSSSS